MWGYGLKSLGIHKCSCKFMDWNAGNTYVINLIPLGYLFIHWNAWENICDGFYPLEYRLKCWEIHMWWILSNGIMDWNAGKYTCNEFWSRIMDRKVFMAKVGSYFLKVTTFVCWLLKSDTWICEKKTKTFNYRQFSKNNLKNKI